MLPEFLCTRRTALDRFAAERSCEGPQKGDLAGTSHGELKMRSQVVHALVAVLAIRIGAKRWLDCANGAMLLPIKSTGSSGEPVGGDHGRMKQGRPA